VITRAAAAGSAARDALARLARRYNPTAELLFAAERITTVAPLCAAGGLSVTQPPGRGVLLAGIGNPAAFRHSLEAHGVKVEDALVYPDHYAFTRADLARLSGKKDYFITAKDAVKMRPLCTNNVHLRLWVVDIALIVTDEQGKEVSWPVSLARFVSVNI